MSQKPTEKSQTRTRGRPSSGAAASRAASPNKVPTTPVTGGASSGMQDMLKKILDRLDAQDAFNASRVDRDNEHRKDHMDRLDHLTQSIRDSQEAWGMCRKRLLVAEHQLCRANERNRRLESQLNTMENRLRVCNVRIEGKAEEDQENLVRFVVDLAKDIGVNLAPNDLASATRLGKRTAHNQAGVGSRHGRPRTIMVTFYHMAPRNRFYFARSSLRNIDRCRGIYINDDVTQQTRRQREDYRSVAALAREDGAEIRVHDDGLLINGHKHLLSEPHSLPAKYSVGKARTIELNDEIYFSSEHSFLSNFFPALIVEEGVVYSSAEHMYQSHKCRHAGEMELMNMVLAAPTALDAKRLADSVQETPEWRKKRDEVMTKVVCMKFDQNADLAKQLVDTGDKPLNEATRNEHFGIGVTLHSREIKDKSYRGTNKLGQILVAKRTELHRV